MSVLRRIVAVAVLFGGIAGWQDAAGSVPAGELDLNSCLRPTSDGLLRQCGNDGTRCDQFAGAFVCLTPGAVRIEQPVMLITVQPGTSHQVQGYIDSYRFTLPGGVVVDVPCVTLGVDGTSSPCAEAGGTFVSRSFTIVDTSVREQTVVVGPTVATVRICDATLTATVLGFGVQSAPAFALC